MAHALGVGFGVIVVAGEEARPRRVDQLTYGFIGVGECSVSVEPRDGALGDGFAVVHRDPVGSPADRARWRAGFADHDDRVLGRAKAVLDLDSEAA
ncbi:Uncharacterised protein [Mycobacterium tuberculosis]|nr:Uncharacterised protein [Mycobacterium tuberculosis]